VNGLAVTLLSLMILAGNAIYGSVGLRGSDQYWYVGDLRMSDITGMPVTNAIYPVAAAANDNGSIQGLPPRIHNLPVTYLADFVHRAGASDYLAWVYVNFVIALIIAVAVYFVAKCHGYSRAYLAPTFFLAFPLTLWLSINALGDMSLALGSCLIMIGATAVSRAMRDDGGKPALGLLIIATGSILMFYTRDNYILLFPAQAFFMYWVCRSHRKRWILATPILAITALLASLKHVILPQYPNAGMASLLTVGTPSNPDNTLNYYGNVPFSASAFIFKAINGLKDALLPSGPSELITEFPIIIIAIVALFIFRKNDDSRAIRFWMFVVLFIYLITSAAFQTQNRYIFPLVPFVAVFGVGLLDRSIRPGCARGRLNNVLTMASACFVIICLAASLLMARTYQIEATAEVKQTARLIAGIEGEPSGSVLAVAEAPILLPLTYAAIPRPVLAVWPRVNSTAEAARLIVTWKVRVLASASETDLQYLSKAVDLAFDGRAKLISKSSYETPRGRIILWRIEPGSAG